MYYLTSPHLQITPLSPSYVLLYPLLGPLFPLVYLSLGNFCAHISYIFLPTSPFSKSIYVHFFPFLQH